MGVLIKPVAAKSLSKTLAENHVELTDREAKLIDYCHTMSLTTWVGYNNDKLVCAWGIIPPSILSEEVYLWLHTTEAVNTNQFLFVRHSQLFVQDLLKEYTSIIGHVKIDAHNSKRWLKWLGATFSARSDKMLSFRIRRKWQIPSA
jgi:hypothetical protein